MRADATVSVISAPVLSFTAEQKFSLTSHCYKPSMKGMQVWAGNDQRSLYMHPAKHASKISIIVVLQRSFARFAKRSISL